MNEIITCGIKDSEFIRSNIPMTKEEVRILTISKLGLKKNSTCIDIGAGTGSISIEIARIIPESIVYSIEKKSEAVDLINKNMEKFKITNIKIINGTAPDCLSEIKHFTHAVVGGSGGELLNILKYLYKNIHSQGKIVVNAVKHETLYHAFKFFKENDFDEVENIIVNISKSNIKNNNVLYNALNPVNIVSGVKR